MAYIDRMTNDEQDEILEELVEKMSAPTLLAIPGVYELLREELNNALIEQWEQQNRPDGDYLREWTETDIVYPNGDFGFQIRCTITEEILVECTNDGFRAAVLNKLINPAYVHSSAYDVYKEAHTEGLRDFPIIFE